MMRNAFLKVRTSDGKKKRINTSRILLVSPGETGDPKHLKIEMEDATVLDVVGTLDEFDTAVMMGLGVVVELHNFTFEDQEKADNA